MKWKEEYSTGIMEIDEQHKFLFAFSEDFREALEHGFGSKTYDDFLEFLRVYSDVHFSYEDTCMLAHKCPVADRNRREHFGFTKLIQDEEAMYQKNGFDSTRAFELLDRIDSLNRPGFPGG